ncbi:MAG: hypothetical protein IKP24_00990 [Alphaproteobacteria bacterium]|nr:hypothetical protein [Alphaproteobacteria bacterium]
MKKIVLFGLVCVMSASTANAGWFSNLFSKQAEPTTLGEACNTDEITSICPEIALGEKTLTQCLSENVKSLSKKCAKFVKKSVADNKELILENKDAATNAVTEKVQTVKNAVAEKKASKGETKKAFADKKAKVKADAKAAAKEIKDTATAVKNDAVETGKSLKEIAK